MIALEQDNQEQLRETAPRVTAHGHLALMDWERPQRTEDAKVPHTTVTTAGPIRRPLADQWFERGLALLVITTFAAVCACMAHL